MTRAKEKLFLSYIETSHEKSVAPSRFLNDFDSVSISMAKNQNISLNPNKINGVCGRLLCCLKYENDNYKNSEEERDGRGRGTICHHCAA
jgi:cell fate regulator YaaT (PSP1 superfamily)